MLAKAGGADLNQIILIHQQHGIKLLDEKQG
jgi:hypothetical protein